MAEPRSAAAARSERSDAALVQRARCGDRGAFDALYARYAPAVHGVLVASAPASDVDDLMQDVFLSAWRSIRGLCSDDHVGGWLVAIARNRARRFYVRRRETVTLTVEAEAAPARAARTADGREILETLRDLPEAYRETLAMRLAEGLSGPEIAAATGLTHGSVRVNLTRGMKLLRELLRERGFE